MHCYDKNPDKKWANRRRLSRKALTASTMLRRMAWAEYMRSLRHTARWYFKHCVWVDICNTILPTCEKKCEEQTRGRKSDKTWASEDAMGDDINLAGDKRALKMNSWDTQRVWWMPVLTMGKLHVELLPASFPGDRPEGMDVFVAKVRAALNCRFPSGGAHTVVCTDRGAGFYNPGDGFITSEYKTALQRHRLRAFNGDDASVQPGSLSDLMLHETAVAWIRHQEGLTLPRRPWTESREAFGARMKQIVVTINGEHDVDGLCRELPMRIGKLIEKRGGKLRK